MINRESWTGEALIQAVREAGVVGEGGAGFPAHVKYDTRAGIVIANGSECEPLLATDQHLMKSQAPDIVRALLAVKQAIGAERGVVAIKRKHERAVEVLSAAMAGADLELFLLDNFYPAGDEQILIHEITGRTVPPMGLPRDVDALVANVGTLASVARAMDGHPVTHKIVTVTGDVARPAVLRVPVGTPVADCVTHCGGPAIADPVWLLGGPMMGRFVDAEADMAAAVITKTSGGIIILPRGHYLHEAATLSVHEMEKRAAAACIQCRYCTDLCPRYLIGQAFETHRVMRAFGAGRAAADQAVQAAFCCECGVCELFSCPMRLSPRRINALLKKRFRENKVPIEAPREIRTHQAALRPFRKIPTDRLALKVDIARYMDLHPEFAGDLNPKQVRIPLLQHIGAPAVPLVKPGDHVACGDPPWAGFRRAPWARGCMLPSAAG